MASRYSWPAWSSLYLYFLYSQVLSLAPGRLASKLSWACHYIPLVASGHITLRRQQVVAQVRARLPTHRVTAPAERTCSATTGRPITMRQTEALLSYTGQ